MKVQIGVAMLGTLLALQAWGSGPRPPKPHPVTYRVTVRNDTKGQSLSPPLIVNGRHDPVGAVLAEGDPPTDEIRQLAEDGLNPPLLALMQAKGLVAAHANAQPSIEDGEPIAPGESKSYLITVSSADTWITVASTLMATNDGFFMHALQVGEKTSSVVRDAWDAGTEFNSESCEFIAGPPCNNPGRHDPRPAEGKLRHHPGIEGIEDLNPAHFNWTTIARISVDVMPEADEP